MARDENGKWVPPVYTQEEQEKFHKDLIEISEMPVPSWAKGTTQEQLDEIRGRGDE